MKRHSFLLVSLILPFFGFGQIIFGEITQPTQEGSCADGSIDLFVDGGYPPYEFIWSNGATTEDIDNLIDDIYSVTITDAYCGVAIPPAFEVFCECPEGLISESKPVQKVSSGSCLIADFSYYTIGCTAQFTDLSIGLPTNYTWYFDDGAVSYEQNPDHIYEEAGEYYVQLIVSDATDEDVFGHWISIESCEENDDDDFIEDCIINGPEFASPGQNITFSAEAIGLPPFNYEWTVLGTPEVDIQGSNTENAVTLQIDSNAGNGEFTLVLDVYDIFGNHETCSKDITIGGNIPDVELEVFTNPNTGYLTLVAFYDDWNGVPGDQCIFSAYNHSGELEGPYTMELYDFDIGFGGTAIGDPPETLSPGTYTFSVLMSNSGAYDEIGPMDWLPEQIEPAPPECVNEPIQLIQYETGELNDTLEVGESLYFETVGSFTGSTFCTDCPDDECRIIAIPLIYDMTNGGEGELHPDFLDPYDAWGWHHDDPVSLLNANFVYNHVGGHHHPLGATLTGFTNDGCKPGSYKLEYYIYGFNCTNNQFDDFVGIDDLSAPCPVYFEVVYNPPEITSFNLEACSIISANIQNGCREEISIPGDAPCTGDQFYNNYQWKAYRYNDSSEEISGLLTYTSGAKCTKLISEEHEYYDEFSGEEIAFYLELVCEDGNGIAAQRKELVTMPKPLRFNVGEDILRCSGMPTQFVLEGEIASGGTGNLTYAYGNYPEWDGLSNPTFDSSISSNEVEIIVTDNDNCTIEKVVTIDFEDLSVTPPSTTINVCETNNSSQTLLGSNPFGTISGGSGEFSYNWTSVPPEAINNLSSTIELNPTVWYDGIADFTLEVTDLLADCTASTTVQVIGSSSTLLAHAFVVDLDEISICYRSGVDLGRDINGLPVQVTSGNVPVENIMIEWTSDNPAFEDTNTALPEVSPTQHAVPGSYIYNLKAIDSSNGCFDEDFITINVRKPFMYTGFVPQDQFIIPGLTQAEAWSSNLVNKIILESEDNKSSGQNPLSYSWLDYTGSETVSGSLDSDFNVEIYPQSAGSHEMQILNGDGCSIEVKTDNFVFLEDLAPSLTIEITNGDMMFCDDEEVCFEVMLNLDLYSTPTSLPSTLSFNCTISFPDGTINPGCDEVFQTLTLDLVDGIQGIYTTNFCHTNTQGDCTSSSSIPTLVNVLVESNEFLEISSYVQYMLLSETPEFHDGCFHVCGSLTNTYGHGSYTTNAISSKRGSLYFAELNSPCHNCDLGFEFPKWGHTIFAQAIHPGKIEFGLGFEGTLGSDMIGLLLGGPNECMQMTNQEIEQHNTIIRHTDNVIELEHLHVYPNPTDAIFTIESSDGFDASSKFTLFSAKGEKLQGYDYADLKDRSTLLIDLSNYNAGMYFIHIQNEDPGKESILKIIKSQP